MIYFTGECHGNFERLYEYPVEEWNGGKMHRIRPSVIYLLRGHVYELEGKKIFTFGGASSHGVYKPDLLTAYLEEILLWEQIIRIS